MRAENLCFLLLTLAFVAAAGIYILKREIALRKFIREKTRYPEKVHLVPREIADYDRGKTVIECLIAIGIWLGAYSLGVVIIQSYARYFYRMIATICYIGCVVGIVWFAEEKSKSHETKK